MCGHLNSPFGTLSPLGPASHREKEHLLLKYERKGIFACKSTRIRTSSLYTSACDNGITIVRGIAVHGVRVLELRELNHDTT